MTILVDTREQKPFSFVGSRYYADVTTERTTLTCGDYSLPGFEDKVAVERKELSDLIQCLGYERERFERELLRGRGLDAFCVVVEANFEDIASGSYHSKFNPHAACQSVIAFMGRYRCPFWLAGSRKGAEYFTYSFLRQYLMDAQKRYKAIEKLVKETA